MNTLIAIPSFVVTLGILIFIHELGHFLVARLFRIRVEVFSLGFGKRLWGFERNGVDYRISAIPLGGYVKMAGENIGEPREGAPDEFLSRPRWQRILVMLAGPAMNIVLALFLITFNYTVGVEEPAFYKQPARVGEVVEGSPAANAGLRPGDLLLAMNGQAIQDWADFQMKSISFSRQKVRLTYRRDGRDQNVPVAMGETLMDPREITGIQPFIPAKIFSVDEGTPAAKAGLQKGDIIEEVLSSGSSAQGWFQIARFIQARPEQSIQLRVLRGDRQLRMEATTMRSKTDPSIGILGFRIDIDKILEQYPIPKALLRSLQDNFNFVVLTYKILGKVLTGHLSFRQFSGPIGIAEASGEAVQTGSITVMFGFMALVSMNLAVLNLLPIPILDGGMIFLLLIEMAIRRDLPVALKERLIWIGFILLVALMAVVIFFDILKAIPKAFG
jgi:regulator of sigma E protease